MYKQDGESQDGGLVFSWAEHRVCLYLEALRRHLPRITEGGSLASVLEHCMYCGMSLARVGLISEGYCHPYLRLVCSTCSPRSAHVLAISA